MHTCRFSSGTEKVAAHSARIQPHLTLLVGEESRIRLSVTGECEVLDATLRPGMARLSSANLRRQVSQPSSGGVFLDFRRAGARAITMSPKDLSLTAQRLARHNVWTIEQL
jgi:hypothetical protein